MSSKTNPAAARAAQARAAQAEYLAALKHERDTYASAGVKDRVREVDAEIKRVQASLKPSAAKPAPQTTRGAGEETPPSDA